VKLDMTHSEVCSLYGYCEDVVFSCTVRLVNAVDYFL